jgi:MFS family permease
MEHILTRPLKILLSTNGLYYLAGAMLGPIYAVFVEEIGGDILDASFAFSIFAIVAGITAFLSGRYTDKIKQPELIIALGYFIISIGYFYYIFVGAVWQLFIAQALIGLGGAVYSPAFDAIYSIKLKKKSAGSAWGAWEIMYYITTAAGAIIGGLIVTYFGFTPIFVIMGTLTFISAFYIYLLPRNVL